MPEKEKNKFSEGELEKILDSLVEGIVIVDWKGKILYVNKSLVKLSGHKSKKALIGKSAFSFIHPDSKINIIEDMLKTKTIGGGFLAEYKVLDKNKNVHYVESLGNMITFQGKKRNIVALRDISEKKQILDELTTSKVDFKNIIDTAPYGIAEIDLKGKYVFVNNAYKDLFGYKPDELIGQNITKFIPEDKGKKELKSLLKKLAGKEEDSKPWYGKNITKKGKILDVKVNWSYKKDKNGKIIGFITIISDITKEKEAQRRFEDIVFSSADWIWEMNQKGKYTFASGAIKEILGYKSEELIGKSPLDLMPKKEAKRISQIIKKRISQKRPIKDLVNLNLSKKGEEVWLLTNAAPFFDGQGKLLGYRGIDKDITERITNEKKLKKNQEKLELITDNISEAIIIFDTKGKILYANKAAKELGGINKYENKNVFDFVHPDFRAKAIKDAAQFALTEKGFLTEYRINSKKEIWVESFGKKIKYEGKKANLNVIRDITERKEAERKVEEKEIRYKSIFESSPEAIVLLDDKGEVIEANKKVDDWLGLDPKKIKGKKLFDLGFLPAESKKIAIEKFRQRKKRSNLKPYELIFRDKKGRKRVGLIKGSSVYNEEKNTFQDLVMVSDITEEKETQEKYRTIIENTSDLISVTTFSLKPVYTYIAPSITKSLFYEPEELLGENGLDYIHPEDKRKLLPLLKKYLKMEIKNVFNRKETFQEVVNFRFKDKKGAWHYLESTVNITENNELLFISRDKTEEIKNKKELVKQERKYRYLFENSVNILVGIDRKGNIIEINQSGLKTFGYKKEDILKKNIKNFIPTKHLPVLLKDLATEFIGGETPSRIIEIKNKKGDLVPVELSPNSIPLLKNNKKVGVMVSGKDLSVSELAKRKISEAEEDYKTIFESSNDALFVHDAETGKILDVNKKTEKTFGYSNKVFKNMTVGDISSNIPPYTLKEASDYIKKARDGEPQIFEWQAKKKNGKLFWSEVSLKKVEISGKARVLASLRDITERKIAEEKIKSQKNLAIELNKIQSVQKAAEAVIKEIKRFTSIDSGGLYISNPEEKKLELLHDEGFRKEFIKNVKEIRFNSNQYNIIKEGKINFIDYKKLSKKSTQKEKEGIKALAIFPLSHEKEVIGCLNLASHSKQKLNPNEKNLIGLFSKQLEDFLNRAKSEEEIKEKENKYRKLFNSMLNGFAYHKITTNAKGNPVSYKFLEINNAFEKITGLKRESIINKDVEEVLPGTKNDPANWIEKYGKVALEKQTLKFEAFSKSIKKWVSVYAFSDKKGYFATVFEDITERKKVEKRIKESEEKYRKLAETSAEGIITIAKNGKIIYANPAFEDLTGYPNREILGKTYKNLLTKESQVKAAKVFKEIIGGNIDMTTNNEYRLTRRDSAVIDIEISSSPIFENGKIKSIMSTIRNITERKKAEEEIKKRNDELEEINRLMVGRELRMIEMKQKIKELEDKLK